MYDESKRFAEALIWVYRNQKSLNTGIVRIFNTYGPHMDPEDGRVVSNFIIQALKNNPITMYGDGTQSRSFCYVSDQVAGIMALINSDVEGPVNVGNPVEFTMKELADKVLTLTGSSSDMEFKPRPPDDPSQRKPDITRAKELLGWEPKVSLEQGLEPTINYFTAELGL
jgi:nucleoside-diphosphate-sugar epimerase